MAISKSTLRFHMLLILVATLLSAISLNYIFFRFGIIQVLQRYPIVITLGYLSFYLWIRIWAAIVNTTDIESDQQDEESATESAIFSLSPDEFAQQDEEVAAEKRHSYFPFWRKGSQSSNSTPSPESWGGQGGLFGGAGASSSFDTKVKSSKSSNSRIDADAILIILVGVFAVVVAGSAFYVIIVAPEMLADAALQIGVSSGMVYPARNKIGKFWEEGIFRKTFLPFLVILLIAVAFGVVVNNNCPQKYRVADILQGCKR